MASVAVITDSTASLPAEMYQRYGIVMIPYYVHMRGRAWRDVAEISSAEFNTYMSSLTEKDEVPKTANPGPGEYVEAFVRAAERAQEIISFHMTSLGSGAYQAAMIGKEMAMQRLRGVRIEVVDTRNVSMGHGWMVLQAARAAERGATLKEILELVRKMIPVTRMIQTADTLRYLYLGGRIGRASHLVGSLLNIKPLISMEDGIIVTLGVARSREGAYKKMAALVQKAVGLGGKVRLALTHAAAREEAQQLLALLEKVVSPVETLFCDLCPALTVHSGPGTVGVCYTPAEIG
jgi:DegV family protein with EDD domain